MNPHFLNAVYERRNRVALDRYRASIFFLTNGWSRVSYIQLGNEWRWIFWARGRKL